MTVAFRVAAVSLMMSLLIAGPFAPLVAAQQPAQPDPSKEPKPGEVRFTQDFYDVTAGVATAFLIPGRAITCVMGGGAGLVVLLLTFGTAYRAATRALEEGCGGKWIVKGEDLMPSDSPPMTTMPSDRK